MKSLSQNGLEATYLSIKEILESARGEVYKNINFKMVQAYWNIGKVIVEDEQKGKERAEYGGYLIKELSKKLSKNYGKGFDESNLRNIGQFYLAFPKSDALRHELTWTHYRILLRVNKEEIRMFQKPQALSAELALNEVS